MVAKRKPGKVEPTKITADTARDTLGAILDRVGFQGERIVVTRHGRELAALVSIADLAKLEQVA